MRLAAALTLLIIAISAASSGSASVARSEIVLPVTTSAN